MADPAQDPRKSAAPNADSTTNNEPSPQQLELRLFERLDGFRNPPPEKAIFREHLSLLLRKGCEYVIGNRRVTPNAVYAVANAIYLRTIKGVAHVSHRQLAEDALTSKRTVTAAIGVLQMIGLIRVVSSHIRRDADFIALYVGAKKWPAFCRQFRKAPSDTAQLELLPSLDTRGDDSSPRNPLGGDDSSPPRVRTEMYTTTTRVRSTRPPATNVQIAYAVDLGINPDGKDLVQLGEEIETARTKRAELRTAARTTSAPGAHTGQHRLTPIERQRIREAQRMASPRPEKPLPAPETEAAAADRLRRGLANAEAHGYRRDPNDPDVLVGPGGRRVWCGALAQLDGRIPAEERPRATANQRRTTP